MKRIHFYGKHIVMHCQDVKLDELVKSLDLTFFVIPAKAGIQQFQYLLDAGSSPA